MHIEKEEPDYKLNTKGLELLKILPHSRHLLTIYSFVPGVSARGVAEFKEDKNHHPGQAILLGSEIIQALVEIAEFAIRSESALRHHRFFGFHVNVKFRAKVPIKTVLRLPVLAEKVKNATLVSTTPTKTLGQIKVLLLNASQKEILAEGIINYKLEEF